MVIKPLTLQEQGFRFVFRNQQFSWIHKAEVLSTDYDCTDMDDLEFEEFVVEVTV